jgi:hypothetical protein
MIEASSPSRAVPPARISPFGEASQHNKGSAVLAYGKKMMF